MDNSPLNPTISPSLLLNTIRVTFEELGPSVHTVLNAAHLRLQKAGCLRLLAPTDYVGESYPALGTLSTEPSCSMRILSQLTSVILSAGKR